MKEQFLSFIWQNRLFDTTNLRTQDGQEVSIIFVGVKNENSGPDFFDSEIQINGQTLRGTVEIHQKASDWYKHKHHLDSYYNNVVLHVVETIDAEVYNKNGVLVPTIQLRYNKTYYENFLKVLGKNKLINCISDFIDIAKTIDLKYLYEKLLFERIEQKAMQFLHEIELRNKSFDEVFYIWFLRNLGAKVNNEQFERLAYSLPFKVLLRHSDNVFQLEALLFGQANFLENNECLDEYYINLKKEYIYLSKKYNLIKPKNLIWKNLRIHPNNRPELRISQFANFINLYGENFDELINDNDIENLVKKLKVRASDYWSVHYGFGLKCPEHSVFLGKQMAYNIIINVIIIGKFVKGILKSNEDFKMQAIELLYLIPAEDNKIIRYWNNSGLKTSNAFETQALLQLYKNYCSKYKCLDCIIGKKLVTKKNI